MSKLLWSEKRETHAFSEHHFHYHKEQIEDFDNLPNPILFLNDSKKVCVSIDENKHLITNYYIGTDWLVEGEKAIYVEPKINKNSAQTDYLKMLFTALDNALLESEIKQLFEIKFNAPTIEIEQQQDILTPLMVAYFLQLVTEIAQRDLKKSYYKVKENLFGKVKGKVLLAQTIKQNIVKNKMLNTVCTYDEFGINSLENRLLKKTLLFIERYLANNKHIPKDIVANNLRLLLPYFEDVSVDVSLHEMKNFKPNPFFATYGEALQLAKLILKRFGYTISNTVQNQKIQTPPFWIDMSKLFELYVLGLLRQKFTQKNQVLYHFSDRRNELDFLLNALPYQMVIDAKYKPIYQNDFKTEDIRQVSGYARMRKVYKKLNKPETEVIECLIIYPDLENGLDAIDLEKKIAIDDYVGFWKLGVKLPIISL